MRAGPSEHQWGAFIAHAKKDRATAKRLHAILTAAGHRVFIDEKDIALGDDFTASLEEAQRRSLATVVLVSKASRSSHFLREEITRALKLSRTIGHRILPVVLEGRSDVLPYGLGVLQSLILGAGVPILEIARRIEAVLDTFSEREGWEYEIEARTILVITGCNHLAEILDRPYAYKLVDAIEKHGAAHRDAFLKGVVLGDLWYFRHSGYQDHLAVVGIGSGAVNGLTESIVAGGTVVETNPPGGPPWTIVRNDNRWALYGERAEGTRAAVLSFVENYLDDYLAGFWGL